MQSHPPSNLIQPSRPTTATHASDATSNSSRFAPATAFGSSSRTPPPLLASSPPLSPAFAPDRDHALPLNVISTFSKYAPIRGTVRIRVEQSTFYCHKEVLALASPFFEDLLAGGWSETQPRARKAGGAQTPVADSDKRASLAPSSDGGEEISPPDEPVPRPPSPASNSIDDEPPASMAASWMSTVSSVVQDSDSDDPDGDEEWIECRLRIHEENASSFQDFLCHIYPRLDCVIAWNNVSDLCRLALKFDVPSLNNACLAFLLPSAAGRPILCMRIAEDNCIPELYKEGSRYTLDNYGNWSSEELSILSPETLLKLERKRSWFLERLLKLGQIQLLRDYACHVACDDPSRCARMVDEKWRSSFSAAFRFGTPQPSIIYRSLRSLEPSLSSPALHLPYTACQNHARLFVADLFDRMFQLGITPARNWTSLTINNLPGAASATSASNHWTALARSGDSATSQKSSARYFLHIEMDGQGERKRERATVVGAT
ncbi:hypothetical protein JCM5296_007283 [Sporobolomyces johnsonii]